MTIALEINFAVVKAGVSGAITFVVTVDLYVQEMCRYHLALESLFVSFFHCSLSLH